MIENIQDLNDKIYKLFGELNENKKFMTAEQYEKMCNALFEGYAREYDIMKYDMEKEYQTKKFELEYRNRELVPRYYRKWWKFWKKYPNAAAESIMDEQDVKFEQYYAQRDGIIEKENAKLDEMLDGDDDDGSALKLDEEQPKRSHKKKVGGIQPTQDVIMQLRGKLSLGDGESSK